MWEGVSLRQIIGGLLLVGAMPAVVFASLSKTNSPRIIRLLATATILLYAVPAVEVAYFWPIPDRGPLSDSPWTWTIDCDLTAIWLLPIATLITGITLGIQHRNFCSMLPYFGLFGFQAGWAVLNTAFYVLLTG
jgi:hypothetical protein